MELTEANITDVKLILRGFYGPNIANTIRVNPQVIEILGEMLSSSKTCSRMMDRAPRPSASKPGIGYMPRQLRDIARRVAANEGVYLSCKNETARRYRTKLEEAGPGL